MPFATTGIRIPRQGEPVDLARFAAVRTWRGTEKQDLHWRMCPQRPPARDRWRATATSPGTWASNGTIRADIRRVVVRFAGAIPPGVKVQYWRKNWPTPAPQWRPGARRGWIGRDDPWHGEWTTVRALTRCEDGECSFVFDPVDIWELAVALRCSNSPRQRTISRRSAAPSKCGSSPKVRMRRSLRICGHTARMFWREVMLDVHSGIGNAAPVRWDPRGEAANGVVLGVTELPDGLRLHLLVTDGDQGRGPRPSPIPADRTIVTLRKAGGPDAPVEGFSFPPRRPGSRPHLHPGPGSADHGGRRARRGSGKRAEVHL